MTPWELIIWAFAIALSLAVVGFAVIAVVVMITAAIKPRSKGRNGTGG